MSIDYARLKELFFAAGEQPAESRHGFAERACADEPELLRQLLALIDEDLTEDSAFDVSVPSISVADVTAEDACPERIGHYRIVREIGRGGMGVVYEAEQESPKRRVALKVISTRLASPELRKRFENETQILALLDHPGIAQIFEAQVTGVDEGEQPYFAMELRRGSDLDGTRR